MAHSPEPREAPAKCICGCSNGISSQFNGSLKEGGHVVVNTTRNLSLELHLELLPLPRLSDLTSFDMTSYPYPLIPTPQGDWRKSLYDLHAIRMAGIHNIFIRSFNAIIYHAPNITSEDVPSFMKFCSIVVRMDMI